MRFEVGGRLTASRAAADCRIEVGGLISTVEGVSALFIDIERKWEIKGPIRANEAIIGKDAHARVRSTRLVS